MRTFIRKSKTKYNGEASPYQEFLENKGDKRLEHEAAEPPEGNPDVLHESAGLWFQDRDAIDEDKMKIIQKVWGSLSHLDREVMQMVGYEGRSYNNCAVKLGMTKLEVQRIVNKLRTRFKKLLK